MEKIGKIFLKTTAVILGLFLLAPNAGAQTTALKKAVEEIKDTVDLLIGAKDSENESLTFRLETFKRVLELAETEAKDLKVKILSFETADEITEAWKEKQIGKINAVIGYYSSRQEAVGINKEISLDDLKSIAQEFKDRRESDFRPITEETTEFFLIHQENKAIETSQKRLQKINKDIEKLKTQKIKNINKADAYLEKAEILINESAASNQAAADLFWERFNATSSFSVAVSTAENNIATSSDQADPTVIPDGNETALEQKTPSIKDLVYASLDDLRGAYQTFIELSSFVRELLK